MHHACMYNIFRLIFNACIKLMQVAIDVLSETFLIVYFVTLKVNCNAKKIFAHMKAY